jgi:hypothetical protein
MSLNLKTFRKVTNSFARKSHFNIGFPDWRGLGLTGGIGSKIVGTLATPILNSFVSAMEMPKKTVTTNQVTIQHGLPAIRLANSVEFGNWTVTFYSDELLLIRWFLLSWLEVVQNTTDHTIGLPAHYKSNLAYGAILSPQDIPIQVYSFKGLFPVEVGAVNMSQEDNSVLTFDVTFSYDYFRVNEPLGYGLAFAFETLGSTALNLFGSGRTGLKPRKINAPMGISVKIPF